MLVLLLIGGGMARIKEVKELYEEEKMTGMLTLQAITEQGNPVGEPLHILVDKNSTIVVGRYSRDVDGSPVVATTISGVREGDNKEVLIAPVMVREVGSNGKVVYSIPVPGYYGRSCIFDESGAFRKYLLADDMDGMHKRYLRIRPESGGESIEVRYCPKVYLPIELREKDKTCILRRNEAIEVGKGEEIHLKLSGGYRIVGEGEGGLGG